MPLEDVLTLKMSAALHDVGKIEIPNKVLHKPGQLTKKSRGLVKEHPVIGSKMVAAIGDQEIVDTVRHHHERWDRRGYPDGISGTDIPLFSRVIAVADSYDCDQVGARSYRPGSSRDEAVAIMRAESGHQYDPDVVEAFLATLPSRSPVVAAFMSLTGPGALWRFVWQLFQRFGSSALRTGPRFVGGRVRGCLVHPVHPVHAGRSCSPSTHRRPLLGMARSLAPRVTHRPFELLLSDGPIVLPTGTPEPR